MRFRLMLFSLFLTALCLKANGQYFPRTKETLPTEISAAISNLKASKNERIRLQRTLELGNAYLFKQGDEKKDIDSAFLLARTALALSKKLNEASGRDEAYLLLAGCYTESHNLPSAKHVLKLLSNKSRPRLLAYLGDEYSYLSRTYSPMEKRFLDTAAILYQQQFVLSKKLKLNILIKKAGDDLQKCADVLQENKYTAASRSLTAWLNENSRGLKFHVPSAGYYSELCQRYIAIGEYAKALRAIIQALKAVDEKAPFSENERMYCHAGLTYKFLNDPKKSNFYFIKVLKQPHLMKSYPVYGVVGNVANNYMEMGQPDKGMKYLLEFTQRFPPKTDEEQMYYHRFLGQLFSATGQLNLAEKNFLQALDIWEKINPSNSIIWKNLGSVYIRQHKWQQARDALTKAEQQSQYQTPFFMTSLYALKAQVDSAFGNYQSAFNNALESRKIRDSIYTVSKQKHAQELEIQYETQQKEADLKLKEKRISFLQQSNTLQLQNTKLQHTKLEQAELLAQNNRTLIGLKESEINSKTKDLKSVNQIAALQKSRLQQADFNRKITIAIIVLLVIVAGLIYRQFREKRQSTLLVTEKNDQLNKLLIEKEFLLKEVHHRVKNNLQTIVDLLESQSDHLDEPAFTAIETSKNRIFAMSLLHNRLYQAEESSTIDMFIYINDLVTFLRDTLSAGSVDFNIDIDVIKLDAARAIPIGLIVNEVITNSLKHAFNNSSNCAISVKFKQDDESYGTLTIADNGSGFGNHEVLNAPKTMGIKLIKGLSRQLDAKLTVSSANGVCFTISSIDLEPALSSV